MKNMLDAPEKSVESGLQNFQALEEVLAKYKRAIEQSKLPKIDKEAGLKFIHSKSPQFHDLKEIQACLDFLPKAEESVAEQRRQYEKKLDDAIQSGFMSKDPKTKQDYLDWFLEQSFEDRGNILKTKLYKMEERKKAAADWKRVPEAERILHQEEWNKLGVEERLDLVRKLLAQHKELKDQFLKLPPEVQERYRTQFKESTFQERRALLQSIEKAKAGNVLAKAPKEKSKNPEAAESERLTEQYEEQLEKAERERLLSTLSVPKYREWFASLKLEDRRRYAKHDPDLQNPERTSARDQFLTLPPAIQAKNQIRFFNADLDKRKEILEHLAGGATASSSANASYSPLAIEHTLQSFMDDPEIKRRRVMFTLVKKAQKLRRRAEIRYHATKTEDLAQHAANDDREVEPAQKLRVNELRHHGEERFSFKRFLLKKLARGEDQAMSADLELENRNQIEVGAEEFKEQVVDHERGELVAKLTEMALKRLPRVDREKVSKVAQRMELMVDLRKEAA
ncbi:hypothetical protein HYV58_01460 [Candidatus Peregrinibacteria bacterium]|nr:hypothetical protein [Candidatus Peregrinibacteria bacterium]